VTNDHDLADWGQRLRSVRKLLRLHQADLARACHVSQATISRWERGVPPRPDALQRLLGALRSHGVPTEHVDALEAGAKR